jgi:acetyl-CoA synthetase
MDVIHKTIGKNAPRPNLLDYPAERSQFSWLNARKELDGLPAGQGLNAAYEAVDRHCVHGHGAKTAIIWLGKNGERRTISFDELRRRTNRFANALTALGVGKGDRVFVLAARIPELYFSVLGALKLGCVVCPMFSAFGPDPIATRLKIGEGSVVVTTSSLYRKKFSSIRAGLPALKHVLLVSDEGSVEPPADTLCLSDLLESASEDYEIGPTLASDPALLHFTSGTTGKPKGAVHVHEAIVAHYASAKYALDFHPDDVFWCTADPGWVTGMSYGILAPLAHGITMVVDEAEFDAVRWYSVLAKESVSVWYTAPTAVRMMMKGGTDSARLQSFPKLRFIASVGEPLNPQAVHWGVEAFGLPIHDNWWQTETGGIMIANYLAMDIRPGSMGKPIPGIEAAVVKRSDDGSISILTTPGLEGELALRLGWPSMFRTYLNEEERYRKCFSGDWYLTGDLVKCDADGYYWFWGRADDIIKSAGHLIGPFEVESALMEHPAIAEAGVIGKPDPTVGEVVKAFVALKPGFKATTELQRELLGFARKRLGSAVAPKEIEFSETLPKTRSGKIMRRLLKARELGLPEGDTSTLESSA